MIIKTTEFVEKFFNDFYQIVFYAKNYQQIKNKFFDNVKRISYQTGQSIESVMNKQLENHANFMDPGYKGTKKIPPLFNFVGSFATKSFGKIMSDIDVNQTPNFKSAGIIIRLKEIIQKTDPSIKDPRMPFSFIRFYLGTISGYEPPWMINEFGNCEFDIHGVDNWLAKIQELVPEEVHREISLKMNKESLSLKDLVEIDDTMRKYTSITWLNEDVQKGYKDLHGHRYDLEHLLTTTKSKIVVKFIYEYNNEAGLDKLNLRKDYMLVDLSLNQTRGDLISLTYYYLNNISYKFKSLKRYLPPELVDVYRDSFGDKAGYLTTVGTRLDLLDKIERYNFDEKIMSNEEFRNLRKNLNDFAAEHGYAQYNHDFREQTIKQMDKDVQEIIGKIREELFKFYESQIVNRKEEFYYYLLRGEEASLQISKSRITERIAKGIKCPFFFLQGEDLKVLINLALILKFDPTKLLFCINELANITGYDSSDIFNDLNNESFLLENNTNGLYNLYINELILATNSVEELNLRLNDFQLKLNYKNREYSLFDNEDLIIAENRIDKINDYLKTKSLYIKYNHYSVNKYELFQWHTHSYEDISLEQAQQIFIVKLLK
jgi:hypothetical protein